MLNKKSTLNKPKNKNGEMSLQTCPSKINSLLKYILYGLMISTAQHVVVRNADVKYILLTGGIFMYLHRFESSNND